MKAPIEADPETFTVNVNPIKWYSVFKTLQSERRKVKLGVTLEQEIEHSLKHELCHIRIYSKSPKFQKIGHPKYQKIGHKIKQGKEPTGEDELTVLLMFAYEAVQDYFINFVEERYPPIIFDESVTADEFANLSEDERVQVTLSLLVRVKALLNP